MGIFRRKTSSSSVLGGPGGDEPSRAYAPIRDGIKAELDFPAKLQDWSPGNVAATLEKLLPTPLEVRSSRLPGTTAEARRQARDLASSALRLSFAAR